LSRDVDVRPSGPTGGTEPTTGGLFVDIENPVSGESVTLELPAENWEMRHLNDYAYLDKTPADGPCRKATFRNGLLSVRCLGAGIAFTLDEASQGSLDVRVRSGSGGLLHCLEFEGNGASDRPGLFRVANSPKPAACP
jgi:hypothetical protein